MEVKIYVLIDPITFKIRYIGRTKNRLNIRLNGHLSKSKNSSTHKSNWVKSLMLKNKKPLIRLFKIVNGWKNSHSYEKDLIGRCIKFGFNLTNTDDRGMGCKNKIVTKEQRLKISNTLKEGYKTGRIKPVNSTKMHVYDLDGNLLKIYPSGAKLLNDLNLNRSALEKVLSGKCRRLKQYQITYGNNPGKYIKRSDYTQNNKPVNITNIKTNEIFNFNSFKEASKYLNVTSPTIRRYLGKYYKKIHLIQYATKLR